MKKLFKGSGLLNLLGMTAAFAALYILLVQVYYDLSYNKQIENVERVYIMATLEMVDSNLHREHILPSEKAKAYKMKMDAVKRQGAWEWVQLLVSSLYWWTKATFR